MCEDKDLDFDGDCEELIDKYSKLTGTDFASNLGTPRYDRASNTCQFDDTQKIEDKKTSTSTNTNTNTNTSTNTNSQTTSGSTSTGT